LELLLLQESVSGKKCPKGRAEYSSAFNFKLYQNKIVHRKTCDNDSEARKY